jgi:hypothetical protein
MKLKRGAGRGKTLREGHSVRGACSAHDMQDIDDPVFLVDIKKEPEMPDSPAPCCRLTLQAGNVTTKGILAHVVEGSEDPASILSWHVS